jgi:probable rRNA maturation factor
MATGASGAGPAGRAETAETAEVVLQNPVECPEGDDPDLLPWLERLVAELAPGAGFTARLTSDREVRRLNRAYRGKDAATDVLSFPGGDGPEGRHLGDVVIAVPVARRQAEVAGHSTGRELRVLLLHGVLHCLGHDHETDDGEMEGLEEELRARWIGRIDPTASDGGDDGGR